MEKLTLKDLEQKFLELPDCTEYTASSGKRCLRTVGTYVWYALMCEYAGIEPKDESAYNSTATGNGYELEYCEHDIILAFDA